jgi:hypothetical protein
LLPRKSLTADNVSDMSEVDILALFVKKETAAPFFTGDRTKAAQFRASMKGVAVSCGTKLSDVYTSNDSEEEDEAPEEAVEEADEEPEVEAAAACMPRGVRTRSRALRGAD